MFGVHAIDQPHAFLSSAIKISKKKRFDFVELGDACVLCAMLV